MRLCGYELREVKGTGISSVPVYTFQRPSIVCDISEELKEVERYFRENSHYDKGFRSMNCAIKSRMGEINIAKYIYEKIKYKNDFEVYLNLDIVSDRGSRFTDIDIYRAFGISIQFR